MRGWIGTLLVLVSPAAQAILIPCGGSPLFPREQVKNLLVAEGRLHPNEASAAMFERMVLQRSHILSFFDDYYENGVLAVLPDGHFVVSIYKDSRWIEIDPRKSKWTVRVWGHLILKGGRRGWEMVEPWSKCRACLERPLHASVSSVGSR